jgi:hypothetical protein
MYSSCYDIEKYAMNLKENHIVDWKKKERLHAIESFGLLTIQMQNLAAQKEITLVQTQPATVYVKTSKKVDRLSKKDQLVQINTKLNDFFAILARAARA